MQVTDLLQQMEDISPSTLAHMCHCGLLMYKVLPYCKSLGFPQDSKFQRSMVLGAVLHDIGKLQVPAQILNGKQRLTPEEFRLIQAHPEQGASLLVKSQLVDNLDYDWDLIQQLTCFHHIKRSSGGYPVYVPNSINYNAVYLMHCIDAYEALTGVRTYRMAVTPAMAIEMIREDVPVEVCDAFSKGILS